MLQFFSYRFEAPPGLGQLIQDVQEYLRINNILRNRNAPDRDTLNEQRAKLGPALKDGFTGFFQAYHKDMQLKGEFIQDLRGAIRAIEDKRRRLEVFTLCRQPAGHFVANAYLLTPDGFLDVKKLEALNGMVELLYDSEAQRRTLLQNSKRYIQLPGMLTNFQLQQPVRDALIQERDQLTPLILDGYNWFFNAHLPTLNGGPQDVFFKRLTEYAECPRSYVASTAQIEFYSSLDRSGLLLVIRRNRASQLATLVRSIDSRIIGLPGADLSQDFFDRFRPLYGRASDFAVRKARDLEIELIPSQEYNDRDGLHTEYTERRCDGNKYRFEECQSRNNHEISRLLKNAVHNLSVLYANVNQKNYAAYCSSPFLEEEVGLVEELYAITHELFFLFNTPIRWNNHLQLHQNSFETRKARAALAGGSHFIYKRIENGGNVASDVVRNHDVSELSRREEVHAAIYGS